MQYWPRVEKFPWLNDNQVKRLEEQTINVPLQQKASVQQELYRNVLPVIIWRKFKEDRLAMKNQVFNQALQEQDIQDQTRMQSELRKEDLVDLVKEKRNLIPQAPTKSVFNSLIKEADYRGIDHNLLNDYLAGRSEEFLYEMELKERPMETAQQKPWFWEKLGHNVVDGLDRFGQGVKGLTDKTLDFLNGSEMSTDAFSNYIKSKYWVSYPAQLDTSILQKEREYLKNNPDALNGYTTTWQQDALNTMEWGLDITFTAGAPYLKGAMSVAGSTEIWEAVLKPIGQAFGTLGNFVNKIPGLSNFRDSLSGEDQERFDAFVWNVVWGLILGTKGKWDILKSKNMSELGTNLVNFAKTNLNPAEIARNFQENVLSIPRKWVQTTKNWISESMDSIAGLDKKTQQALENNAYVGKWREKTKQKIEDAGISPETKKEVNTAHIEELSKEILDLIEDKKDALKKVGGIYDDIRKENVTFDNSTTDLAIQRYLEDNGIKIKDWKFDFSDSVIVKESDMKAIERAYEWATREEYWADVALNQRQRLDKLAYPDWAPSAWTDIVKGMREIFDKNMKSSIPGLKDIDKLYSERINELNWIKDGLTYREWSRKGQIKDNFNQIINTLDWPNRARMLERLDSLRPGLWDEIRAVHMMGKLADAYFKTPSTMANIGTKITGAGIWALGGFQYGGIGGWIAGAIAGMLWEIWARKISQTMVQKAIDKVSPESLKKLEQIEKQIEGWKGLSAKEKATLDKIGQEIPWKSWVKKKGRELNKSEKKLSDFVETAEKVESSEWNFNKLRDWAETSNFQRATWEQKYGVADATEKTITPERAKELKNFRNGRSVEEIAKDYGVEINIVDKITTPEGVRAYGKYGDGVITLAEKIKEGTAPHELFHATFDLVDSTKKESILEGVMKEKKLDKVQAEEYLADSFSEYFRTGRMKGEKVIWNVGKPLWKRIYDAVKDFFQQVKDWITGVSKNKNQIKKLFDDILDGEIDKEMLWEILGNKKGTDTHRHQQSWPRLVSVPMKSSISITPENASIFTSRLNNLDKVIKNWGFTATDFLDGLKNNLNIDKKSWYLISQKNGSTATLRISDHYANARNNKIRWYVENNTSIVIKLWSGKFKAKNGVDLVEFVYNPENLTPEKMQGIIKGIQDWIDTGEYTDKGYDLTHKSIRASLEGWEVKYQLAYHGSPYDFEKFDSSHMWAGAGSQSHGWGHYVAVDNTTARSYATNQNWKIAYKWKEINKFLNSSEWVKKSEAEKEVLKDIANNMTEYFEKAEDARDRAQMEYERNINSGIEVEHNREKLRILRHEDHNNFVEQWGNLYEVEIPDPIKANTPTWSNYLEKEWAIKKDTLNKIYDELYKYHRDNEKLATFKKRMDNWNIVDWETLQDSLSFVFQDDKAVSKFLESLWYDGIHYHWGKDWEVYIIFDDNKLEIKKHFKDGVEIKRK